MDYFYRTISVNRVLCSELHGATTPVSSPYLPLALRGRNLLPSPCHVVGRILSLEQELKTSAACSPLVKLPTVPSHLAFSTGSSRHGCWLHQSRRSGCVTSDILFWLEASHRCYLLLLQKGVNAKRYESPGSP